MYLIEGCLLLSVSECKCGKHWRAVCEVQGEVKRYLKLILVELTRPRISNKYSIYIKWLLVSCYIDLCVVAGKYEARCS